jgi:SOS-response transcriptional repressor LexA
MLPTTSALTYLEQKVLNHITDHVACTGLVPSLQELCLSLGYASTFSVRLHLRALEAKRRIRISLDKRRRSIELCGPAIARKVEGGIAVVPGKPMTSSQALVLAGELLAMSGKKEVSCALAAG